MLNPKSLDDDHCAACARYILDEKRALPFNKRSEGPYFCSEPCFEEACGLSIPVFNWEEPDADYFIFDDVKRERSNSPRSKQYIVDLHAYELAKHEKQVIWTQGQREWHLNYFIEDYREKQRLKKSEEDEAQRAQILKDLHERGAQQLKAAEKQRIEDEKAAEKERLREEKEYEKWFNEEQKWQQKEDERLRLEAEEEERLRTIPLIIPSDHARFEHVHILGAAGSGKTTLIQEFILHDLQRGDSPGLIVIDPKGMLVERIKALRIVDPDRLVVINASHPHPAKLGLIAKSTIRGVDSEQVLSQAISTYKYIFESTKFAFTPKQAILLNTLSASCSRWVVRSQR
jgi:primosomal protein N'